MAVNVEEPQSRVENYLGVIAGLDGFEEPEVPLSREEKLLAHMIEHGIPVNNVITQDELTTLDGMID